MSEQKEFEIKSEEWWDEFSELIGTDISDLDRWAGSCVIDQIPEEMPEYVSYKFLEDSNVQFFKVGNHFQSSFGRPNKYGFMAEDDFRSYSKSQPATLSEYNTFIESKNKK